MPAARCEVRRTGSFLRRLAGVWNGYELMLVNRWQIGNIGKAIMFRESAYNASLV